jgi:DNA-binding PadR family transcriptional regulator
LSYYELRRMEILGNRTRKVYRNSAAAREYLRVRAAFRSRSAHWARSREEAIQAAMRRLERLWR